MTKQPKKRKIPGFMREVLAQNVRNLVAHHFSDSRNKPMALAKAAGVTLSTAQRIMSAETGPSLDTIEAVASVFDLSAYQLLIPSLDPANPPIVKGATKLEERVYRLWMQNRPPATPHN